MMAFLRESGRTRAQLPPAAARRRHRQQEPAFSRRVARTLHLPATTLDCGGVCHGTMTVWFNHHFKGSALTVEYGARPPRRLMRVTAPRQVLRIFGAFGSFGTR